MIINTVHGYDCLAWVVRLVVCIKKNERDWERETEDLEIEIGVSSLWSLTRNAKLYYFHLDFKRFEIHEAWNATLFSFSYPLSSTPSTRCSPLLCSFSFFTSFRRCGSNSCIVYWCCQFNFFWWTIVVGQKEGCSRGRGSPLWANCFYLSWLYVRWILTSGLFAFLSFC